MLSQFGDNPQPVRRVARSRSLGPAIDHKEQITNASDNQASPIPRFSRSRTITDSPATNRHPKVPEAPAHALHDVDTDFTFRSTYSAEFGGGKVQQLRHQERVPFAGSSSHETNVSRTRRCRSMAPRDALSGCTMDVTGARKPTDKRSIASHFGYFGPDGQWKACPVRKRNEECYMQVHKLNDDVLQDVMQPLGIPNMADIQRTALDKIRSGQRFRNTTFDKGEGGVSIGTSEPPPFKPAKRLHQRSRSVPSKATGPEQRVLDYHEDWAPVETDRSGRRILCPIGQTTALPQDGFKRQHKAHVPSRLQDHHDMLFWQQHEKLNPKSLYSIAGSENVAKYTDNILSDREKATLRRLEQLQRMEAVAGNIPVSKDGQSGKIDGVSTTLAARIAEMHANNQQRAGRNLVQQALPHGLEAEGPLVVGASREGKMEMLRGRKMGYPYSCQTDNDPIVGVQPVSATEEVNSARQHGLRTGYVYQSHQRDHDPIALRPVFSACSTGAVRTRRAKSAM